MKAQFSLLIHTFWSVHVPLLLAIPVTGKWAATWQNQQNDVPPAKTQISLGIGLNR